MLAPTQGHFNVERRKEESCSSLKQGFRGNSCPTSKQGAGSQNWQPSVLMLSARLQETHLIGKQLGQVRLTLSQLAELLDQHVPATETPRSELRPVPPAQGPLTSERLELLEHSKNCNRYKKIRHIKI